MLAINIGIRHEIGIHRRIPLQIRLVAFYYPMDVTQDVAGMLNGRIVSSDMVGLARCVRVDRMASAPSP